MNRRDFDALVTAALPRLEGAARRIASRRGLADQWRDIAQEAFLKMFSYSESYDPAKGDIMKWGATVMINCVNSRATPPPTTDYYDSAVSLIPADTDIYSELHAAFILDHLNREARMYYEGYNLAEIATASGLSGRSAAKWRIDSCADNLARTLGHERPMGRRERVVSKKSGRMAK